MGYQGMRSSKSKLKASVYWRTRGQFKFNFFATRMSESQSDCFFSVLEHATVPVRATKFAEVEIGLNISKKNVTILDTGCVVTIDLMPRPKWILVLLVKAPFKMAGCFSESAWDIKCRVLLSLNVIESYLGTESLSSEVVSESNFVYVFGSDKVREAVFIKGNNPVRFLFCCKGSRTYRIVPRETSI